jgi:hypothetical protein
MNTNRLVLAMATAMTTLSLPIISLPSMADDHGAGTVSKEAETVRRLEQRIQYLEQTMDERLGALADAMEQQQADSPMSKVHFGGYGELNYYNLDVNGTDDRQLDFRRWVLFVGYDFSDSVRLVSEFEVEHTVVPGSDGNGAIELEQAYLEFDLSDSQSVKSGILLMPVGILSETHEPTAYYGVERPIVETTIIPTTWFAGGVMYSHSLGNGLSYDLMISEGLKTDDPNASADADPFDLKAGKQKTSFADAFDLATTARLVWRGVPGLELAVYGQYQPDLDQSAETSYADSATLMGSHVIYQQHQVTTKALYARWDVAGDAAKTAGKDVQDGGYLEVSWKPFNDWGFFARQSAWSQQQDVDKTQTDVGFNYYPVDGVVLKTNYQLQNDDAGNADGFYLGMGYQF